jgi:hypothetical protein
VDDRRAYAQLLRHISDGSALLVIESLWSDDDEQVRYFGACLLENLIKRGEVVLEDVIDLVEIGLSHPSENIREVLERIKR